MAEKQKSVSNEDLLKEIIELKKQLENKKVVETVREYVPYPVFPYYPYPYPYPMVTSCWCTCTNGTSDNVTIPG